MVVARNPHRAALAVLAEQATERNGWARVDDLRIVAGVRLEQIPTLVPDEFRRTLGILLAVSQAVPAIGASDNLSAGQKHLDAATFIVPDTRRAGTCRSFHDALIANGIIRIGCDSTGIFARQQLIGRVERARGERLRQC